MNNFNKLRIDKKVNSAKNIQILVCSDTGCSASKSLKILEKLNELSKENNIQVIKTGCLGLCSKGPFVIIKPNDTCYGSVSVDDCEDIMNYTVNNKILERLLVKDTDGSVKKKLKELNFYKKQDRRVLGLCGEINPESIEDYIKHNGYLALEKALSLKSENIIYELIDSKLRGKGGAGYPTGLKWRSAYNSKSEQKYIVCNADEGDPGAFMDRSILEGNPHSVIEAMIIGAYTIKASKGYIYIRAEYPNAVKRLRLAIKQAYEYKLLGNNILDTDFKFDLEIRLGAGAFVCGEETALLESIEGKKGNPRGKPPFPTDKGLWGHPTVINNVETLSAIPNIILNGSKWFKQIGTNNSGGTKVFALGGNVINTGLVEVPIGLTLRELVFDIGGGIPTNKTFKAAQTGGPSGGCIPASHLDTKIDYEELKTVGSMMGSGGLIVMDESKCMVSLAKFYIDFSVNESCGKCTPCRIGNKRMYEILDRITKGKSSLEELEELESLANMIAKTSICGLGQSAPNPVLSTLKYFKDEYIDHITNHKCTAGECRLNTEIKIIEEKCKSCGLCQKVCPSNAIEGKDKEIRIINQEKCIKCKACISTCPFKAIEG